MRILSPRYILFFILNLSTAILVNAKIIEHNTIDFPVLTKELFNGEIHLFFNIYTLTELKTANSLLFKLDSFGMFTDDDSEFEAGKAMYVVNVPVGFFNEKELLGKKYLSFSLSHHQIREKGKGIFDVYHKGETNYSFEMRSYFDADDISTLPNSKVSRAVLAARELDVISKSASTIMVTEKTNFSNFWPNSVTVTSFIPIKERKTLVITYRLTALRKNKISRNKLKEEFKKEIERTSHLQNSFLHSTLEVENTNFNFDQK
jgi:hypothetical protein